MTLASHLNLASIESRMMQIVIDLHDAARLAEPEAGVAAALRGIGAELALLVHDIRRLLCSDVDSAWTELEN